MFQESYPQPELVPTLRSHITPLREAQSRPLYIHNEQQVGTNIFGNPTPGPELVPFL
jgi:hypothetical protein